MLTRIPSVKPENYELVYTAPLTEQDSLESIYPES